MLLATHTFQEHMFQSGKGRVLEGNQSPWRYWLYSPFCVEIPTGRTEKAPEPLPETFCGVSENRQSDKEVAIITDTYTGLKC